MTQTTYWGRKINVEDLLNDLERTKIYCLSNDALISKVEKIWEEKYSLEIIYILEDRQLSKKQNDKLFEIIVKLSNSFSGLDQNQKSLLDRRIKRLCNILYPNNASKIANLFENHKRSAIRKISDRIYRIVGIKKSKALKLFNEYLNSNDEEILILLARYPNSVKYIDYNQVLENLTEQYWKMRIIEQLLKFKKELAYKLSRKYSFEFIYAVGRLRLKEALPQLQKLLPKNKSDLEVLSIYIWTVGRISALEEIPKIYRILKNYKKSV